MRVLLRFIANLLRLLLAPLWFLARSARRKRRARWVYLRLPKNMVELRSVQPLWRRLRSLRRRNQPGSIQDLRELVRYLLADKETHGLCLRVDSLELGWAACESVRELLLRLRGSGKRVVVYLAEGGGNRELYLASAADRIVMAPWSTLGPLGFAAQSVYFKNLLSRLGVQVEVQATGPYKSAAEPLVLDQMSDAAREQQAELLAGLQAALEHALKMDRGLAPEKVEQLFARGMLGANDALASGVIDDLAYEDELAKRLGDPEVLAPQPAPEGKKQAPAPRVWQSANAYLNEHRFRLWQPLREPPYVGVVSVAGTIAQERREFMPSGADRASVVGALRHAAADPQVRAVVLHVDSPGGSAFASELIHHEVERLAAKKPVIAYFGNVAASGGYYIASACKRIVSRSLTVTGSIGVVSAKPAIADLLARLGVNAQTLRTAPHADMFSSVRPLSPDEARVLHEHTLQLYARFLEVVATGRQRPVGEIEALAGGRVWSGTAARAHGLVDELGGIDRALELAREQLDTLPTELRESLQLRACTGKGEGGALPPQPERERAPAVPLSWLGDLSFLLEAQREPAAYYAWGLSGYFG